MIGIDTNVLVRYFVKDDLKQTPIAVRLIRSLSPESPGWIALLVLTELTWTLRRTYKMQKQMIAGILETLLDSDDLILERRDVVRQALQVFRNSKADFADCAIAVSARLEGCSNVATFDEIAARDTGMELLV